jgi:hypothetical protein
MAAKPARTARGGRTDGRTDARAGPRWRAAGGAELGGKGKEELAAALLLLMTFR